MENATFYLSIAAVGAVVLVLAAGLINMFRGGSTNTSQQLMRWRVGLQAVAILILFLAVYFKSH